MVRWVGCCKGKSSANPRARTHSPPTWACIISVGTGPGLMLSQFNNHDGPRLNTAGPKLFKIMYLVYERINRFSSEGDTNFSHDMLFVMITSHSLSTEFKWAPFNSSLHLCPQIPLFQGLNSNDTFRKQSDFFWFINCYYNMEGFVTPTSSLSIG